ncbi:DUF3806 domain-containing protein [Cellulomonas sp. Sa3CUA2]|uniref:DUF3806 domain-containing protein n=1 Tax=Cellulomonas avistercoris TaxID=2762242 RepID=A0ABR8QAD3_9CELL|nr:DUF3806 domain-containing protein [Cellulomonas avistercoris]MBD7917369.1 DUF3806 domain-containing protein [Cellulomonas avistercoris]
MLPTPHGPTDVPLPAGAGDATVDKGRAPDEVALLRVVEHLADVPDGEATDGEHVSDEVADEDAEPAAGEPDPGEPDDDDEPEDAGEPEDAETFDAVAAAPPAPAAHAVGPVAAALSDTRHRIDELNAPERLFLAQQRALVAGLCADPSDAALVSALFDRVREQWQQADDRPDPRPLADAFGVALGDLVCAQAEDLGWATCSDRYGTEIVLAREDPEILVYPVAAVAQHWSQAAPGWLLRHLATVVQGVLEDRAPTDD